MEFNALDHSVNIVAYEKNNIKYGMCCAWAMMADFDKVLCLLGADSATGKHIEKNDFIGFSSLSKNQKDIARALGEGHSDEVDKFKNIKFTKNDSAILIPNAAREIVCQVIDIYHLDEIKEDFLIFLKVVDSTENGNDFLHTGDM